MALIQHGGPEEDPVSGTRGATNRRKHIKYLRTVYQPQIAQQWNCKTYSGINREGVRPIESCYQAQCPRIPSSMVLESKEKRGNIFTDKREDACNPKFNMRCGTSKLL